MSEEKKINWRTIGVKRERKFEQMIAKLSSGEKNIFKFNKDLMVFAAMIGYSKNDRNPLDSDTIDIILDTYSSDQKDGFIYLLALMDQRDATCLKDENLHKSVEVFEEYCNGGLKIIQGWLDSNPGDISGIDTILQKIYAQLCDNEKSDVVDIEDIELEI